MSNKVKASIAALVIAAVVIAVSIVTAFNFAKSSESIDPSVEIKAPDKIESVDKPNENSNTESKESEDIETDGTIESNIDAVKSAVLEITSASQYTEDSFNTISAKLSELGVTIENPDDVKAVFIAYTDDLVFSAINVSNEIVKTDSGYTVNVSAKRAVSPTYGLSCGVVASNINSNLEITSDKTYDCNVSYTLSVSEDGKSAMLKLETPGWWE